MGKTWGYNRLESIGGQRRSLPQAWRDAGQTWKDNAQTRWDKRVYRTEKAFFRDPNLVKPKQLTRKDLMGFTKQNWKPFKNPNGLFKTFNREVRSGTKTVEEFCKAQGIADKNLKNYFENNLSGRAKSSYNDYCNYTQNAIAQTKQMSLGFRAASLAADLFSLALNTAITMGIGIGIQAIVGWLDKMIITGKEAVEMTQELRSEYENLVSKTSQGISSLEKQEGEFLRLSRGVDEYGRNISLTAEEYENYKSIVEEIVGYSPELVSGYDEEGNALVKKNGLLERSIELMKEEVAIEKQKQVTDQNVKIASKAAIKTYNDTKSSAYKSINASLSNYVIDDKNLMHSDADAQYQEVLKNALINLGVAENEIDSNKKITQYLLSHNFSKEELSKVRQYLIDETPVDGLNNSYKYSKGTIEGIMGIFSNAQLQQKQVEKSAKGMNQTYQTIAETTEGYSDLTDTAKNFISSYVDTMSIVDKDGNPLNQKQIVEQGNELRAFLSTFIGEAKDNVNIIAALTGIDSLDDQDLPVDEYVAKYKEFIEEIIKNINTDEPTKQKLRDALFPKADDLQASYDNAVKTTTTIFGDNQALKKNQWEKSQVIQQGEDGTYFVVSPVLPNGEVLDEQSYKEYIEKLKAGEEDTKKLIVGRYDSKEAANQAKNNVAEDTKNYNNISYDSQQQKWVSSAQSEEEIKKIFEDNSINTETEIKLWNECAAAATSAAEAVELYNKKKNEGNGDVSIASFNEEIDAMQESYQKITTAQKEYEKYGRYSVDTIQDLLTLSPEYLRNLTVENGKITLNTLAMQENTRKKILSLKADILKSAISKMEALQADTSTNATKNATEATDENTNAEIENSKAKLKAAAADAVARGVSQERVENMMKETLTLLDIVDQMGDATLASVESTKANAKQMRELNNQLESSTISNEIDKIKISIDELSDSITKLKDSESLLPESDFLGKITLSQKSIELTTKKTSALVDEFNRLKGIVPSTSESANTLANRMKEVGEEIFESKKAIYEYQTEIAKNYMSALNGLTTNSASMTDEAVSNFEKNMENLEKGSLTGLRFNVTPNVPLSAVEKQESEIEQLRDMWQSYYDDITAMQKTALELKHAEDVRSYNESMADLNEATTAAVSTIKDTNDTTSEIQKEDHKEKKAETQGYVDDTKIIIADFNTWIENNPTKAPTLDNNAWHNWVNSIKGYVKQVEDVFDKDWLGDNQLSKTLGTTPKGNALSNDIKEYLGTKYVWGGTSPSGFDCSGLMQYIYEKNGINIPRTTYEQYPKSKKVDYADIQPGDLIFTDFNKSGLPEHVGMYIGNDTVVAASSSNGKVVEQKLSGGYWNTGKVGRFYATGTKDYGIAGENYKKEYAINKKTGEWSIVDSPTLFDKDEYDIVGEKVSEKIDKPIDTYANGTTPVPDGLGKTTKWMNWKTITDKTSQQYKLKQTAGMNYDSEGYGTINGRKVVAMTNTFGKIGDYVNIHLTDGTVIQGVIGDEKDQTWAHGTPANKWGHDEGENIIEYITNWNLPHENPSLNGAGVAYVDNLGNYFDDPTIGLDNIVGAQTNAQKNKINPYVEKMGEYIKDKRKLSSENDETFYKNMAQLSRDTKSNAETLGSIYDELKDSAGTNMYDAKESAFVTQASKWIQDTMTRSSELILDETKRQFETAKESYDLAEDYFNKRVAEGASASELEALREGMKTLEETMNKASDAYVKQSENYTKLRIADQQLERQKHQDDITKTNKKIEDADYEIETNQLLYDRVKSNNAIVDEARSQVAEVLSDSKYQDILAGQDIEKWFNGENEQSAYFKKYLQAVSEANPEDSVLLTQVFEVIQDAKKAEAEALKQITEDEKQMALNQVEAYIKLQERKKEVLDYVYEKNQAIIDAESKRNELLQSIRDTERDYAAELKANKDLGQWLDEDTRALLFNEEDYSTVMGKISNIKNEIYQNEIWYQNEIAKLDENDIYQKEMLTQQLENMNARSQESLEIAKQELDVAKKTAEYNNIAKERDTQIILGNRKVNVANPESLYNAAKEMSNAQILLNDTKTKYNENEAVRQKQENNDLIKNESAALSALTQALNDMPEKLRVAIASVLPSFEISTAEKANIEKYSPNWIAKTSGYTDDKTRDIIKENKADGYDVTTNYTHNKDYIKQAFVNGQITREQYERIMSESDEKHGLKDAKWEGNRYNADTENKDNILKTDVPPKYPSSVFIDGIEYKKLVEDMSATEKIQMDYPNIPVVNWKDMLSYDSRSGLMFPTVSWDNMSTTNPLSKSEDNSTNYTIQGDIVVNEASDVKEIFEKSTELIKQKSQNTNNMRK